MNYSYRYKKSGHLLYGTFTGKRWPSDWIPQGQTTASRMDKYTPKLLDLGLSAMIGKGKRSEEVLNAIVRNKSVYMAAVGGAGALLSKCILSSEVVAYEDLGTEAIRKLEVKDFPVIVVADCEGNYLYESAIKEYKKI